MIDLILSPALGKKIVETIQRQCQRFQRYEAETQNLFYEPYAQRRRKYDLTAAVLSGFAPGKFKMEGVSVEDVKYGLETCPLFQPELHTDTAVIQIYSNGANLSKNKTILKRCQTYNSPEQSKQRFLLIQFTADKNGELKNIEVLYPNGAGEVAARRSLYARANLELVASAG